MTFCGLSYGVIQKIVEEKLRRLNLTRIQEDKKNEV